jgi:ATP synthase protein I
MENVPPPEGPAGPRRRDVDPLGKLREGSGGVGSLGAAGKYVGLGIQFALSILLFLYLGQWLDRRVGTNGLFTLLGVFLGAGAAFYSMYRKLMADQRAEEAAAAQAAQAAEAAKRSERGEG